MQTKISRTLGFSAGVAIAASGWANKEPARTPGSIGHEGGKTSEAGAVAGRDVEKPGPAPGDHTAHRLAGGVSWRIHAASAAIRFEGRDME